MNWIRTLTVYLTCEICCIIAAVCRMEIKQSSGAGEKKNQVVNRME